MDRHFDRAAEDLGNIVGLEHVNVTVPDQQVATTFYVSALGLTRDPYLMTGTVNMWVNVGRSQFHLPGNKPQVLRGRIGIVLPDRAGLVRRLTRTAKQLEGTRFGFKEEEGYVAVTCPWGNQIRCHEPNARFGAMTLGIPYVEFDVPEGSAEGIARFYHEIMGTLASIEGNGLGRRTEVSVGAGQHLVFCETDREIPAYDGHHIQVYVNDFSGPHRRLAQRGLIFEESDQHQYRFRDIVDPQTGEVLFTIEHEVRSMRHPLYMRPLVNRNPSQNIMRYASGHDAYIPAMAEENGR